MTEELNTGDEDRQILTELVINEKIVVHPTKGDIKLVMPTLEIQRKIDASQRVKKKVLKLSVDKIPDEASPDGFRMVPSYKSRDALVQECKELGWWSDAKDARLQELHNIILGVMTQLELIGFHSEEKMHDDVSDIREALDKHFRNEDGTLDEGMDEAILMATTLGATDIGAYENKIADAATSTDVDDMLANLIVLRRQFLLYVELASKNIEYLKLQTEYSSIVSDSWQEQLQHYVRLAQVYFCSSKDGKPLWASLEVMENDRDVDFIRWIIAELNAFWQGWTDETRARVDKYSFTSRRNRLEPESTEDSPVPSKSSVAGESPDGEPTFSSVVMATKETLPESKSSSVA